MIPDYRNDTGRDAFGRIAPRVLVSLLGLALVATSSIFALPVPAFWSACIVGFVLVFIGVQGFWLPFTHPLQLAAAAWVAVSGFVFGVRGPALWSTLAIAAALLAVTRSERLV